MMTNEEAIFCENSYLGETNCVDCKYYGTDTCKSRESHKMAVEALKQQETEYWIEDWESGLSECPVCHDTFLWEDFKGVGSWHYCPNCGKKLEVKRQ